MTTRFNVEVVTPDGVDQYEEIETWRANDGMLIVTVFADDGHQVIYAAGAWLKVESEAVEVDDGS